MDIHFIQSCIEVLDRKYDSLGDLGMARSGVISDIASRGGLVCLGRAQNFNGDDVPMASVKLDEINLSSYGRKNETIWDVLLSCLKASIRDALKAREFQGMAEDMWGSARVVNLGESYRGDGECIEVVMGELRFTTLPVKEEVWGELRGHRITGEPVQCDGLREMIAYIANVVSNTSMEDKGVI